MKALLIAALIATAGAGGFVIGAANPAPGASPIVVPALTTTTTKVVPSGWIS